MGQAAWNTQTAVTTHIPLNRSLVKLEMKTHVSYYFSPSTKEPILTQLFVQSPGKSKRTRNHGNFEHDHQPNTPPQKPLSNHQGDDQHLTGKEKPNNFQQQ